MSHPTEIHSCNYLLQGSRYLLCRLGNSPWNYSNCSRPGIRTGRVPSLQANPTLRTIHEMISAGKIARKLGTTMCSFILLLKLSENNQSRNQGDRESNGMNYLLLYSFDASNVPNSSKFEDQCSLETFPITRSDRLPISKLTNAYTSCVETQQHPE